MAHKVEQAVDLETGAVVAVTLAGADQGDTTTLAGTLIEAAEQAGGGGGGRAGEGATGGGGDHRSRGRQGLSQQRRVDGLDGLRAAFLHQRTGSWPTTLARPAAGAGRGVWESATDPGGAGPRLLRWRAERVERSFAHLYDRGGMQADASAGPQKHFEATADSGGRLQPVAGAATEAGRGHAAGGTSGKEGPPTVRKTAIGATADLEPLPPCVGFDVLRSETAIPLSKSPLLSLKMTTFATGC